MTRPLILEAGTFFITGIPYNKKITTSIPKEETAAACVWVNEHSKLFKQMLRFNAEAQEGPHKVLLTNEERDRDAFAKFVFGDQLHLHYNVGYAYYYNGSEVSDVKINGQSTVLKAYKFEISKTPSVKWLDANLKPIWFRDVTKKK